MIYVESPWSDPYINLALEEYLLTRFDAEIFMLWRNDKSVIVGKNQNTLSEINSDYVNENSIAVVRRLTGGGAVFHDMGNLNFSFMVKNEKGLYSDFAKFTAPIISALRSYGLNAEYGGRNDITIDGKKISGNAQAVYGNRLLHHGTLLFHADFSHLVAALNVNEQKIQSKGIKSNRARVTNICEHKEIAIEEFMERVAAIVGTPVGHTDDGRAAGGHAFSSPTVGNHASGVYSDGTNTSDGRYILTEEDIREVTQLAGEKYRTWEWNYGYSPKYSFHNEKRFDGGCLEAYVDVKDGIIQNVKFYGDFFARSDVGVVESALVGKKHKREEALKVLERFNLNEYFLNITAAEVAETVVP